MSDTLPLEGGFGRQITPNKALFAMHDKHGHGTEAQKCGQCEHLKRMRVGNSTFFKCRLYGDSGGPASDWRLKWEACGAFKEETK